MLITIIVGKPNPATTCTYNQVQNECEEGTAVSVNIFWNFPKNTKEFILKLRRINYDNIIRVHSLVNNVTVLLPRGMYRVDLCTRNHCGELCQRYSDMEIICNSQLETESGKDRSVLPWNF